MSSDDWAVTAERLGLAIDDRTAFARKPKLLRGTVDGVEVEVRYQSSEDNTRTKYAVELPGPLPFTSLRPRWLPSLRRRQDAFGNVHWSSRYVVRSPESTPTDLFVHAGLVEVLDELRHRLGRTWRIRDGVLRWSQAGRPSGRELEQRVHQLTAFARALTPQG